MVFNLFQGFRSFVTKGKVSHSDENPTAGPVPDKTFWEAHCGAVANDQTSTDDTFNLRHVSRICEVMHIGGIGFQTNPITKNKIDAVMIRFDAAINRLMASGVTLRIGRQAILHSFAEGVVGCSIYPTALNDLEVLIEVFFEIARDEGVEFKPSSTLCYTSSRNTPGNPMVSNNAILDLDYESYTFFMYDVQELLDAHRQSHPRSAN